MRASSIAAILTLAVSCASRGGEDASAQADSVARSARAPIVIAPGAFHTCVLAVRKVRCWGGEPSSHVNAPPPLLRPTAVTSGKSHACAIDDDGVKCWGSNASGQLNVPPLRNPRQVDAGSNHTCAIDDDGVKCWGSNSFGTTAVPASLENPSQVGSGTSHSCALTIDGVKCWGSNDERQTTVPPLGAVTQLAVGGLHNCALDARGVSCWGDNLEHQTEVPAGLGIPSQIAAGSKHTCALGAGAVTCWGDADYGQRDIPLLRRPSQIATFGGHVCALDDDGVKCWGRNDYGQTVVPADLDLVGRHACIGLRCVGENEYGQLGAGNSEDRVVAFATARPADLGRGFEAPSRVVVGLGFGCALGDGAVKCWGYNARGRLGIGDERDRGQRAEDMGNALPALAFDDVISRVAAGEGHACALGSRGDVFCWGAGSHGQLGSEDSADVTTPRRARLAPDIRGRDIALGRRHTCVLSREGSVYCFGSNASGQLGLGHTRSIGDAPGTMMSLEPVSLDFEAAALASGDDHVCALSKDGRVKCWGGNANGELGLGDRRARGVVPDDLGAALPVVDLGRNQMLTELACGTHHCCVRTLQNTLKCWGDNTYGQLGLGDVLPRGASPDTMGDALPFVMMQPRERVLSLTLTAERTCARTESGLRCWGRNGAGELGYGDRLPRGTTPATIPRLLAPLGI